MISKGICTKNCLYYCIKNHTLNKQNNTIIFTLNLSLFYYSTTTQEYELQPTVQLLLLLLCTNTTELQQLLYYEVTFKTHKLIIKLLYFYLIVIIVIKINYELLTRLITLHNGTFIFIMHFFI